jgi:hypothetical protein
MTEINLEFQMGETWTIPFTSEDSLTGAELRFRLAQADIVILDILDADSPSVFGVDSPAVSGSVVIEPDRQDYSTSPDAGLSISPGAYNYEIRADHSMSSPASGVDVLAYGKIIVQASLFAWPVT